MIYDYHNPNLNFCAKPIGIHKISRFDNKLNKFIDENAHFIVFENENSKDLEAVKYCAENWKTNFSTIISTCFHWAAMKKSKNSKVYALTLQRNNFDNLNPEEILGIANITEYNNKKMTLEYMQVRPDAINIDQSNEKKFAGCGTALVKSFQKIYNTICLNSTDKDKTQDFYLHNGFIRSLAGDFSYIWKDNLFFKLLNLIARCFHSNSVD